MPLLPPDSGNIPKYIYVNPVSYMTFSSGIFAFNFAIDQKGSFFVCDKQM